MPLALCSRLNQQILLPHFLIPPQFFDAAPLHRRGHIAGACPEVWPGLLRLADEGRALSDHISPAIEGEIVEGLSSDSLFIFLDFNLRLFDNNKLLPYNL